MTRETFNNITGYKSKWLGYIAYDTGGNTISPVNKLFPCFIKKNDVIN